MPYADRLATAVAPWQEVHYLVSHATTFHPSAQCRVAPERGPRLSTRLKPRLCLMITVEVQQDGHILLQAEFSRAELNTDQAEVVLHLLAMPCSTKASRSKALRGFGRGFASSVLAKCGAKSKRSLVFLSQPCRSCVEATAAGQRYSRLSPSPAVH